MALTVAASGDANALAIRDHLLPIVRAHGTLEDLEDKDSPLRLLVLKRGPWCFRHWTPFNALTPTQASSPGYRHALERQHTTWPDMAYGLDVSHDGANLLSLLWTDAATFKVVNFVRVLGKTRPWQFILETDPRMLPVLAEPPHIIRRHGAAPDARKRQPAVGSGAGMAAGRTTSPTFRRGDGFGGASPAALNPSSVAATMGIAIAASSRPMARRRGAASASGLRRWMQAPALPERQAGHHLTDRTSHREHDVRPLFVRARQRPVRGELANRIKEGAIPIISDVPGFRAYYVIYAPDDTVTAISIFDNYAGAENPTDAGSHGSSRTWRLC